MANSFSREVDLIAGLRRCGGATTSDPMSSIRRSSSGKTYFSLAENGGMRSKPLPKPMIVAFRLRQPYVNRILRQHLETSR
jgi:hypothetical protein